MASMPAEVRAFSISSQVAGSSSTINARFSILVNAPGRQSRRQTRGYAARCAGIAGHLDGLGPTNFIAIEAHAHAQLALRGVERLDAHDVAGAAPLRGRLAGNLFGHLEQHFDGVA